MDRDELTNVLESLQRGDLSVEAAGARLFASRPLTAPTGDAHVDLDRRRRCGYSEVIFCQGKPATAVAEIFRVLVEHDGEAFGTRCTEEQAAAVLERFPDTHYNPVARTLRYPAVSNA